MALSIKDADTERLVRTLADRRGTGLTGAIRLAVSNELDRDEAARAAEVERKMQAIRKIQARVAELPVLRTDEEIDSFLYDENGLPH